MDLREWSSRFPWMLVLPAVLLVALGLAAIARCDEFSGTARPYCDRQVIWSVVACMAMFAATLPSQRWYRRHAYLLFGLSILMLIAVLFFPPVNGARRWIRVGPIGLQPSELAKLAYVIALARYLNDREFLRRVPGVLLPAVLTAIPMLLILKEPDLGTAAVFVPVFVLMLCAAGLARRKLAVLALVGLCMLPVLWSQMSLEQRSRVTSLFDQAGPNEVADGEGYQLRQAKQMIALGNVWGSFWQGDAADDRAAYRLPAAHSDFIFCVIGERFGLPGMALVLLLYACLVWQAVGIALATRDPFARMLAFGLGALLAAQVVINTGMAVGLLPITGLSLPLISYGGSGLLAHALAIGLVINVAMRPGYEVAPEPFRFVER